MLNVAISLRLAYATPMVRLWYKSHLRIEILPLLLVLEVRDELPYGIPSTSPSASSGQAQDKPIHGEPVEPRWPRASGRRRLAS